MVLGSPIWLSLLVAVVCVVLSVYIVIWVLMASLYTVDAAIAISGLASILGSVVFISSGNIAGAGCCIGAGLVCIGLSVLLFFGCNRVVKVVIWVSKGILRGIKS